ncbi:hypothetical protein WJX75_003050 [Coccomyxa subellipsoidea]|uniref:Uncharacterized protein n=1 Tax=Coccomyxa subellipsoidea TaxID=248742 RepID=A0ABR2YC34_9CHLO
MRLVKIGILFHIFIWAAYADVWPFPSPYEAPSPQPGEITVEAGNYTFIDASGLPFAFFKDGSLEIPTAAAAALLPPFPATATASVLPAPTTAASASPPATTTASRYSGHKYTCFEVKHD